MNRFFGYVLLLLGSLCMAWCILVFGSFTWIAAKGFIGTGGNEAGGELLAFLVAMFGGGAVGFVIIKFGTKLLNRD